MPDLVVVYATGPGYDPGGRVAQGKQEGAGRLVRY